MPDSNAYDTPSPANPSNNQSFSDSAWISTRTPFVRDSNKYKGECLMETNTQDELKAHLMATSEEFRGLATQHAQLHKQLEELEAKQHLTDQEQLDEVSLKKQKLHLKDQMNAVLSRSKTRHVA
jgi:uncharacterized protein YdcH (DUF465 family)